MFTFILNPALTKALGVAVAAGSFVVAGVAVGFQKSINLVAAAGSFALTGVAGGLSKAGILVASAASFVLSGQPVARAADAGAFILTGIAAALRASIIGAPASFVLTGQDAMPRAARSLPASVGAMVLSGVAAGLVEAHSMAAAATSFALTGNDATLSVATPLTLSYQTDGTSSTTSVSVPASAAAGDLAVLVNVAWNDSAGTAPSDVSDPTGWTSLANFNFTPGGAVGVRYRVWAKVLVSGDLGGSITGLLNSSVKYAVMQIFRPATGSVASFAGSAVSHDQGSGDPAQQTIAASGGTPPLIVFGLYTATAAVTPRTSSFTADRESSPATRMYVKSKVYNSAPVDVTIDMPDEGTGNALAGWYISCS